MQKIWCIISVFVFISANILAQETQETTNYKENRFIMEKTTDKAIEAVKNKYPEADKSRIERGVKQTALLWQEKDGTSEKFINFCTEHFVAEEEKREQTFQKLSRAFEIIDGYFHEMEMDLSKPLDLDMGEITTIDKKFGAYNPSSHLDEDLFKNKIAFQVTLNFPFYSLEEKQKLGKNWSRKEWAYARLGDKFTAREPAGLLQNFSETITEADTYISEYNIYMGNLRTKDGESLFPENMKLISHWGLRDELKSDYGIENGLEKQEMIYQVMQRIINQEIPENVINNKNVIWHPYSNTVSKDGNTIQASPEPDTRYQKLLDNFHAVTKLDKHNPNYPTYIKRAFEEDLEIKMEKVEELFKTLVSSPQVKKVGKLISKRLGRELRPFDIWYDGFKARSGIDETKLDRKTREKYPTRKAFEKNIDDLLEKLEFPSDKADYISNKIQVDPARGAGHAAGAEMKGANSRLRTRMGENGMNYKGYNIAIHELGHTVEQTISLYDMDYYPLAGVPNTAFTEALAFLFQKRDLELLGEETQNPDKKYLRTLDNFWGAYEIMGVSLVDMQVWKWLYDNPNATKKELKEAVIRIAKEVWNKYYAEVFGTRDEPILAIYSHMISYPLYLPAYPIGQVIEFQLEEHLEEKPFGEEVHRIYKQGNIIPQNWMKEAVGNELSVEPLLEATDEAVNEL